MTKTKKIFGAVLAAMFAIMTFFSYAPVQAAAKAKAPVIPQVQFVSAPITEYTVGDRVRFDISAPNYGGKVEYRVVLWEDSKKTYHDLWNSGNGYPNRYYTKWQPWGNNVFTLGWPILEPGNYRITVYAKRVGISNDKAFLKGQNCDSYKQSVAFTVKPKVSVLESVLDKDGQTYGSNDANKPEVAKNDVYIMAKNVTLANATVEGNLYISADNASAKNVVVTGTVIVNPGTNGQANLENVTAKNISVISGGKDSIHLKSVKTETLTIESSSNVRVEATGTTKIGNTIITSQAILDSKEGTFGTVTISKSISGKYTVELRGTFLEPIVVEADVDLVVTAGTTVKVIDAKTSFNLLTEKGAVIKTLDSNGNSVVTNGEGTIEEGGNTGNTQPDEPSTPPTTVYDDNKELNAAIENIVNYYNNIWTGLNIEKVAKVTTSTTNNVFDLKLQKNNSIYAYVDNRFEGRTLKELLYLGQDKILAKGPLADGGKAEQLFALANTQIGNVTVDGTPINKYIAAKLTAKGKLTAAAFFNDPSIETYNALYAKISAGQYDEYTEILNAYNELLPTRQVNVPELNVYGLDFSNVLIGTQEIYNNKTGMVNFDELASDVKDAIGYDGRYRDITLDKLVGKNVTVVFTHGKVEYKYIINFKGFADLNK